MFYRWHEIGLKWFDISTASAAVVCVCVLSDKIIGLFVTVSIFYRHTHAHSHARRVAQLIHAPPRDCS